MTETNSERVVAEPGWGAPHLAAEKAQLDVDAATHYFAIQRAVDRYAFAFDQRDIATLREVMTADAEWSAVVADQIDYGTFVGIEAIIEFMTAAMAAQTDQRRHVLSTPVLQTCAEGAARYDVYLTLMSSGGGVPAVLTTGFYSFWLRLDGTEWRIERLFLGMDSAE